MKSCSAKKIIAALLVCTAVYTGAHAMLAEPWNAVLMIAFTTAMFWHAQLGLQVVIEDYVHHEGLKLAALLGVKATAVLLAVIGVLSVLRLMFGA